MTKKNTYLNVKNTILNGNLVVGGLDLVEHTDLDLLGADLLEKSLLEHVVGSKLVVLQLRVETLKVGVEGAPEALVPVGVDPLGTVELGEVGLGVVVEGDLRVQQLTELGLELGNLGLVVLDEAKAGVEVEGLGGGGVLERLLELALLEGAADIGAEGVFPEHDDELALLVDDGAVVVDS